MFWHAWVSLSAEPVKLPRISSLQPIVCYSLSQAIAGFYRCRYNCRFHLCRLFVRSSDAEHAARLTSASVAVRSPIRSSHAIGRVSSWQIMHRCYFDRPAPLFRIASRFFNTTSRLSETFPSEISLAVRASQKNSGVLACPPLVFLSVSGASP